MAPRRQPVPAHAAHSRGADVAEPPPRLALEIVEEAGNWARFGDVEHLAVTAARAVERHSAIENWLPAAACVALASDSLVRGLNNSYRGKNKPTNVLSFPAPGRHHSEAEPRSLGDIVLADGVIAAEAAELAVPPANHIQHLIVHGLLHLMGYDHETDADAQSMERLEAEILATLGVPDPYAAETE